MHDPTGKQIHHANAIQDDEISVDAHGVKARTGPQRIHDCGLTAPAPVIGNYLLHDFSRALWLLQLPHEHVAVSKFETVV